MDVVPGPFRQPRLDLGVLVGGVVVDDEMDVEAFGDVLVDVAQEGEELLVAVAPFALRGCPGGDCLGIEARAGDVLGDVRSLLIAEVGGLGLHDAVRHGGVNCLRGHHLQKGQVRRLAHPALVAEGAMLGVQGRAGHLLARPKIVAGGLELVR